MELKFCTPNYQPLKNKEIANGLHFLGGDSTVIDDLFSWFYTKVLKFLEAGKSHEAFPRHMHICILTQSCGYNFRGFIVRDVLRVLHKCQVKTICSEKKGEGSNQ